MTETGMLLSNKYRGERKPGFVGYPLPGVTAKLVDNGKSTILHRRSPPDLLQVAFPATKERIPWQTIIQCQKSWHDRLHIASKAMTCEYLLCLNGRQACQGLGIFGSL